MMATVINNCIDEIIAANGNDAEILTATKNLEKVIQNNIDEQFLLAKSLEFPSGWMAHRYADKNNAKKILIRNPYGQSFDSKVSAMQWISENPEGKSLPLFKLPEKLLKKPRKGVVKGSD